ncbi:Methylmalonate-semialdehyde dehydrogenase (CoA acylating) [Heracleum sosnowskyi]|uniref:Methylmalonate-semialdehyde dehydrogenase (CoA acylating) n=1 Tax=Heracleum sosnowskyi TaxID=360622 RepID=A0AAD8MF93_9APIA|nr:Methylmalonate-semialdehyde dehydrogenase (CoA acylating) [Heracleum sosnowskyi]
MGTSQMGDFAANESRGIDTYCSREPLGVCAGICPFDFPAMFSLWMFPLAVTCGNTFILKPSELNPVAAYTLLRERQTLFGCTMAPCFDLRCTNKYFQYVYTINIMLSSVAMS